MSNPPYTEAKRLEVFLSSYVVSDEGFTSPCWLWTKYVSRHGYGAFRTAVGVVPAHKVSYQLFVGPVPDGLQLDHLCRVRHCINPAHLEPVTNDENCRRGLVNQNKQKTHCLCGREYDYEYIGNTGQVWRQCRTCANRRKREARRKPRLYEPNCGTDGGYQSHLRYGEEICGPCQVAHEAAEWGRRGRGAA